MDLSNENVIYFEKDGMQYIQFRKLLAYKDIVNHAYSIGIDKNYRTEKANKEKLSENDYQKAIVYSLYMEDNHTGELPLHDGAVKLLKQNIIITETTNQYAVSDLNNAVFPYMLQPWVIEELQKDNELLSTFHKAFNKMNDKYKFQNQYDASYPHFPY